MRVDLGAPMDERQRASGRLMTAGKRSAAADSDAEACRLYFAVTNREQL